MFGKKSTWHVSGKGALVFMLSVLIIFSAILCGSLWMTFDGIDKVNQCQHISESKYLRYKDYEIAKSAARSNADTNCKVTAKEAFPSHGGVQYMVYFSYEFLFENQMHVETSKVYVSSQTYDKTSVGDRWDNINKRPIKVEKEG